VAHEICIVSPLERLSLFSNQAYFRARFNRENGGALKYEYVIESVRRSRAKSATACTFVPSIENRISLRYIVPYVGISNGWMRFAGKHARLFEPFPYFATNISDYPARLSITYLNGSTYQ